MAMQYGDAIWRCNIEIRVNPDKKKRKKWINNFPDKLLPVYIMV